MLCNKCLLTVKQYGIESCKCHLAISVYSFSFKVYATSILYEFLWVISLCLQEQSSRKSIIQQNITSFMDKIMFIEKRMPELEAEKKVAASTRNFKEAGRIAAELKSLNLEKDKIQIETGQANAELEKAEQEIEETIKRLQELEGLIFSKEKELSVSRFQRLRIDSGTAKAERSAALELSDLEEANLLLEEAQEAESEAEKLKLTCGLKEEEDGEDEAKECFVSMELIATFGLKKLQELAESVPS